MSDTYCYCSPCEAARFRGWRDRAAKLPDDDGGDPERDLALEIIADIARGRTAEGIAEDLVLAAAALLGGDPRDAEMFLEGLVDAEEENQRRNPSERVCPRAARKPGMLDLFRGGGGAHQIRDAIERIDGEEDDRG